MNHVRYDVDSNVAVLEFTVCSHSGKASSLRFSGRFVGQRHICLHIGNQSLDSGIGSCPTAEKPAIPCNAEHCSVNELHIFADSVKHAEETCIDFGAGA